MFDVRKFVSDNKDDISEFRNLEGKSIEEISLVVEKFFHSIIIEPYLHILEKSDAETKRFLEGVRAIKNKELLDRCKQIEQQLKENKQDLLKKGFNESMAIKEIKYDLVPLLAEVCFGVDEEVMRDMLYVIEKSAIAFKVKLDETKAFEDMNDEEKMLAIKYYIKYDYQKLYSFVENKVDLRETMYEATKHAKNRSVESINKCIYTLNARHKNPVLMEKYNTDGVVVYDISRLPKTLLVHSTHFDRDVVLHDGVFDVDEVNANAKEDANNFIKWNDKPYTSKCLSVVKSSIPITYSCPLTNIHVMYDFLDPDIVFSVAPYDCFSTVDITDFGSKQYGRANSDVLPIYGPCSYLVKKPIKDMCGGRTQMNEVATLVLSDRSSSMSAKPKAILCYNGISKKEIAFAKMLGLPIVYAECEARMLPQGISSYQKAKRFSNSKVYADDHDYLLDLDSYNRR